MGREPTMHLDIARVIGEDAMRKLCREFGGDVIYIPKIDSIDGLSAARRIREDYNGVNAAQLARRHNLSLRRIQQIVEGSAARLPGQIDMEDLLRSG